LDLLLSPSGESARLKNRDDSHRGRKRAQERNPVTLPNRLASVALQQSESSAASELESPAFSLRELAAVYLTSPASASPAATSNQNPMHLWLDAKVEP
jgi:hypothetical protein